MLPAMAPFRSNIHFWHSSFEQAWEQSLHLGQDFPNCGVHALREVQSEFKVIGDKTRPAYSRFSGGNGDK